MLCCSMDLVCRIIEGLVSPASRSSFTDSGSSVIVNDRRRGIGNDSMFIIDPNHCALLRLLPDVLVSALMEWRCGLTAAEEASVLIRLLLNASNELIAASWSSSGLDAIM